MAPLFAATVFLSAFLLFQVQPLLSKWILPWYGGGPAIWTICLVWGGYYWMSPELEYLWPAGSATAILLNSWTECAGTPE